MEALEQYFEFDMAEVQLRHFYMYFVLAAIIAGYLVFNSKSKYKIELFFISFYLLTGNLNTVLIFKVPGVSFFEIQPIRFIYLMLLFLIIRKTLLSRTRLKLSLDTKVPWFKLALYAYVILLTISVLGNGIPEGYKIIIDAVAFLVIMVGMRSMADKPSYDLIGKSIIIGAIFSSVISLVQLLVSPYFLRIGDDRSAFGDFIRSNGIFSTEYFNSYYLIIAIAWTLVTIKNRMLKTGLILLFTLGVLSSFQRMSWVILALVLITYVMYIKKLALEKLVLIALSGLAIIVSLSVFYYRDIMKSSFVQDRLTDSVDGRKGYYTMVLDNIGDRPLLGYGDLQNEVYYTNLLRITRTRARATADSGDLHSGYFSALFLYGIPAFVCFTLFVLLSVAYYAKSFKYNLYFTIPFLVSILYLIGNLTNTFLFLKYISILYALHIGIGMGIKKLEGEESNAILTE